MAWKELGYYKGWTVYWEDREHKMYAKPGGWGDTKHFYERPRDMESAWAVFRSWVSSR